MDCRRNNNASRKKILVFCAVALISIIKLFNIDGLLLPKDIFYDEDGYSKWRLFDSRTQGIAAAQYIARTNISDPVYHSRWAKLQDHCCKNYPNVNPSNLSDSDIRKIKTSKYVLVDDKYKVIYCKIPKIACTTWQRMFLAMHGFKDALNMTQSDVHHRYDTYWFFKKMELRQQSDEDIRQKLQTYKTFVVVRDPMERILSAYRDKLMLGKDFYELYSKRILLAYREGYKWENVELEFHEYLRFLLEQEKFHIGYVDEHWDSFFNECLPCNINYDVIGKFESIQSDSNFILKYLGWDETLKWPSRGHHYNDTKSGSVKDEAYQNISDKLITKIQLFYNDDIHAFDYGGSDNRPPQ